MDNELRPSGKMVWLVQRSYDNVEWETFGLTLDNTKAVTLLKQTLSKCSYVTGDTHYRIIAQKVWE